MKKKKHYIRPSAVFEDIEETTDLCDISVGAGGQPMDRPGRPGQAKQASFYDFEEDSVVNDPFADPLVINEEFEYSLNIPY